METYYQSMHAGEMGKQSGELDQTRLISLAYECLLTPSLYPELLEQMGRYLDTFSIQMDDETIVLDRSAIESHFKRAMQIQQKISGLEGMAHAFSRIFNRVPIGILLIRRDSSIATSNQLADDLLNTNDYLSVRNGQLLTNSVARTARLHDMIQKSFSGQHHITEPICIGSAEDQISIWVTDSTGSRSSRHAVEALAIMFLYSPKNKMKVPLTDFIAAYHLSSAEGRLASTLINGFHTLNEAAVELGVSKHTVRTQIKSVFNKTDTNSQTELIKKILMSPTVLIHEHAGSASMTQHDNIHTHDRQSLRLKDGRRLEWDELGSSHGAPVIVFHDRIDTHPDYELATGAGLRMIVPKRPGAHGFDHLPDRTFMDWPDDIRQLADHMGLENFSLIGLSEGGPYALACINQIPERIRYLSLVSCMAPVRSERDLEGMLPLNHMIMRIAHHAPKLLGYFMSAILKEPPHNISICFDAVEEHQSGEDAAVLNDPDALERFLQAYQEVATKNPKQLCEEIILAASDWPLDPGGFDGPVSIWHGVQDPIIPIAMGQRIASVLPDPHVHFVENEGNYLFHTHWNEILEELCEFVINPISN